MSTGQPHWFICAAARRARVWPDPYPPGHDRITRTGRTKPNRGRHGGRMLPERHEYVCECGHRGWTAHHRITRYPLAS